LFAALDLWIGSQAGAAQVDAKGSPAPVGFADVIQRVKPTVVGVRAKIDGGTLPGEPNEEVPFPPESPLERFFRQFGLPTPHKPTPKLDSALGSGFFVSGDGYVVTNNHVVANGKDLEVTTDGGKTYQAQLIGSDPLTDLALIKVSGNTDFPFVTFAEVEPRIGDWVLPVGNPFGLGGTVTAGIVSARGRDIGAGPYDDFIQIDAPVNKGNSGGPTFNVKGEVIGVNTAIFSPSGGSVGVAFDVPAETVKLIVGQLKDTGHVTRGWIGVQVQSVTPTIAEALGMKSAEGTLVAELEPGGPAVKSDLEVGDVITSVNGHAIKDSRELARKIAAMAPGTSVRLDVFRNGQEKTIVLDLGTLPEKSEAKSDQQQAPSEPSSLGLTLAPASKVPGAGDRGVVITGIDPNGRAAESGLQTGDVILNVGQAAVNTPADVRKFVNEAHGQSKHSILMRVKRGDATTFVAVSLG
jgi:serine protease Do